jgi:hypothetical protein
VKVSACNNPQYICLLVLTQGNIRVLVVFVCVALLQVCLPAIWALSLLLVTYRLGVLPAESAASLKLLDKGVAKEALAALVLVQFPVELVSAVIAGRYETRKHQVCVWPFWGHC